MTWPLSGLLNCPPSIIPANQLSDTYSYNIPKNLPSGHCLLRFEPLGIHNPSPAGTPQCCIECAQVTVINGGTGTPRPLASIPEWVKGDEPGCTVNIYNSLTNYITPGPAVWTNQGTGLSVAAAQTAATQAVAPTPATTAVGDVVQKYGAMRRCELCEINELCGRNDMQSEWVVLLTVFMMECRSSMDCMTLSSCS